jgi:hypothetical protein
MWLREIAPIANMSRSLPIALAAKAYRAEGQGLLQGQITNFHPPYVFKARCLINYAQGYPYLFFFSFGTTAPILALAYLHETLRFTSVH